MRGNGFLSIVCSGVILGGLCVMAEEPPAPPPLPPIADPAHPTVQAGNPADLFAFVPDVVAEFGDGSKITRADVTTPMLPSLQMAMQSGRTPTQAQLTQAVTRRLDELVNRRVLGKICKEAGFVPDMAAAEKEFAAQEKQAGAQQVAMYLKMQGMDRKAFVAQLGERRVIDQWIEKHILPGIKVEDAAVATYFEKNKQQFATKESVTASHILVKVEDASKKDEARKEIDGLVKRLKEGGDFAALAKAHSDCPSKAQGGSLGSFGRGQMVKPFEEVAFTIEPGKVSGVVETQFGYHVIKVSKREDGGEPMLNDTVKARINDRLRGEQVTAIVTKKIEETRKAEGVKLLFPKKG